MPKCITLTSHIVVLVEGPDEERFYRKIADDEGIADCQFQRMEGKNNTRPSVRALRLAPGNELLRAVGIILDDDGAPADAFKRGADALQEVGWIRPEAPGKIRQGVPATGVLLVEGNLDRLCAKAVGKSTALSGRADCIDQFLDCAERIGHALANRPKSWVHAFLSIEGKGDVRVGEGAERGAWPLDDAVFDAIRRFLHDLVSGGTH